MKPALVPAVEAPPLLAGCTFCDALNRLPPGLAGARCWRCAAPLDAVLPMPRERLQARLSAVLALLLSAWVCLFAAHAFPLIALELQGQHSAVSLIGAARALWAEGREPLAIALFVTLVGAPLGEAAAMLLAVTGLQAGLRVSAGPMPMFPSERPSAPASRWLIAALHVWQTLRHWNLTEVLILAAGVAMVKLGEVASLVIGPALVALMAFMALRLVALRLLPPEHAWPLLKEVAR